MHSYSDDIVPKDFLREGRKTPEVCIGTNPHFTPPALAETAERRFREAGFTTARNYPYSGCLVPNAALSGEVDCIAVMLEFNNPNVWKFPLFNHSSDCRFCESDLFSNSSYCHHARY